MKRDSFEILKQWKSSSRRKPLILQGARQVGKTYLLKEFGKSQYSDLAYFNFEEDRTLNSFFEGRLDPRRIIEGLSVYAGKKIRPQETLIIFDEIQNSDAALSSLKYFQENANEYHLIGAGSLLGLKISTIKSFPVGKVNLCYLYPLSFLEFLSALGKNMLREVLDSKKDFTPLEDALHQELNELLKTFFFIGGMPEVVAQYIESRDFNIVREVQKEILNTYILDFSKHAAPSDVIKISQLWQSIPGQLAKDNKRFFFSAISKNARARQFEDAFQWLLDAGLVYKCRQVKVPRVPLSSYCEHGLFKVYLLDTGLLGAMSNLSARTIIDGNSLFVEYKSALTENFAAQELIGQFERNLFFWASSGIAEVDFVLQQNEEILPLEIKTGTSNKKKSLLEYGKKYSPKKLLRASTMNFKHDGKLWNCPLYALCRLEKGFFFA